MVASAVVEYIVHEIMNLHSTGCKSLCTKYEFMSVRKKQHADMYACERDIKHAGRGYIYTRHLGWIQG